MGGLASRGRCGAWPSLPGSPARRAANDLLVAASAEALQTGGTKQHAHFWAATGLSAELFREEGWRGAGFESLDDLVARLFEEDYGRFATADLLCQLAKWRSADVSRHAGGDLGAALGRISARTVVAAFSLTAGSRSPTASSSSASFPAASSASSRASGATTPGA